MTTVYLQVRCGINGGWQGSFSIDHQTFYFEESDTKAAAWWYLKNIKPALLRLNPNIKFSIKKNKR